jgi:hypothetical protein
VPKVVIAQLEAIAKTSCAVLRELPRVQWVHSYVTEDTIYCVYVAPTSLRFASTPRAAAFPPIA